jgi:hypothetical protein
VLQKPDAFPRSSRANGGGALLHEGERFRVSNRSVANAPFHVVDDLAHRGDMASRPLQGKRCASEETPA